MDSKKPHQDEQSLLVKNDANIVDIDHFLNQKLTSIALRGTEIIRKNHTSNKGTNNNNYDETESFGEPEEKRRTQSVSDMIFLQSFQNTKNEENQDTAD